MTEKLKTFLVCSQCATWLPTNIFCDYENKKKNNMQEGFVGTYYVCTYEWSKYTIPGHTDVNL